MLEVDGKEHATIGRGAAVDVGLHGGHGGEIGGGERVIGRDGVGVVGATDGQGIMFKGRYALQAAADPQGATARYGDMAQDGGGGGEGIEAAKGKAVGVLCREVERLGRPGRGMGGGLAVCGGDGGDLDVADG